MSSMEKVVTHCEEYMIVPCPELCSELNGSTNTGRVVMMLLRKDNPGRSTLELQAALRAPEVSSAATAYAEDLGVRRATTDEVSVAHSICQRDGKYAFVNNMNTPDTEILGYAVTVRLSRGLG